MPPPVGIQFNPEPISVALFNLLQTANFAFASFDRRGREWSNVSPADQPHWSLIEVGYTGVQNTAIGEEKWLIEYALVIYIRADADQTTPPATTLNAAFKALCETFLTPYPGEKQRLGGLVNNVWIEGRATINTAINDQQAGMIIPILAETGL